MTVRYRSVETKLKGASVRVGLLEAGAEGQDAVVFLHGLGADSSSFEAQLEGLQDRFHVIAWDAPGFGESDALPDKASIDDLSEVLASALEKCGLKHVHVVSSSFGTLVALALAKNHPKLVRTLVLSSPTVGFGARALEEREHIFNERKKDIGIGAKALAEKMAPMLVAEGTPESVIRSVQRHGEGLRLEGFMTALGALVHTNGFELAKAVTQPTLVLVGSSDRLVKASPAKDLSAAIARSKLVTWDHVGHSMHVEDAPAFNDTVAEFAASSRASDEGR